MRKSLLMLSAAVLTLMLAGVASASPGGSLNPKPGPVIGSSGSKIGSQASKSTMPKYGSVSPTPPLGKPIPAPAPKVGPVAKCDACKVGGMKPTPPAGGPAPMPPAPAPAPAPGMGHGHHHHNHGHFVPGVIGLGLGAAAVAALPVYEAAPAYADAPVAYAPAPVAAPVAVAPQAPVVANPFDDVIARLNQLNGALSQGLITQGEYRSQRSAILAALDAGQVSRGIGIQQGLRQLKSMADAGFISGKEYDDKRREFVLYI